LLNLDEYHDFRFTQEVANVTDTIYKNNISNYLDQIEEFHKKEFIFSDAFYNLYVDSSSYMKNNRDYNFIYNSISSKGEIINEYNALRNKETFMLHFILFYLYKYCDDPFFVKRYIRKYDKHL